MLIKLQYYFIMTRDSKQNINDRFNNNIVMQYYLQFIMTRAQELLCFKANDIIDKEEALSTSFGIV